MKLTPEQIAKLPKFAREEIETHQRQRDEAVRRLNEMTDNQTVSPFFIDEFDCTSSPPESRKVYFQTHNRMKINHGGVLVEIYLRGQEIEIKWETPQRHGDVCFRPTSYQSASLLTKENMR